MWWSSNISNSDDTIDSRDVIARIAELEDDLESAREDAESRGEDYVEDDEARAELDDLLALQDGAAGAPDWEYGETLVRDDHFADYARELAYDLGLMGSAHTWPFTCIDWEAAALELRHDYTAVDYVGVTYWIRA